MSSATVDRPPSSGSVGGDGTNCNSSKTLPAAVVNGETANTDDWFDGSSDQALTKHESGMDVDIEDGLSERRLSTGSSENDNDDEDEDNDAIRADEDFDNSDGIASDVDPVDFSTNSVADGRSDNTKPIRVEDNNNRSRHDASSFLSAAQQEEVFHSMPPAAHHHGNISQYHSIQQLASSFVHSATPANDSQRQSMYDLAATELFRKAAVDSLLRGMMQHAAAVGAAAAAAHQVGVNEQHMNRFPSSFEAGQETAGANRKYGSFVGGSDGNDVNDEDDDEWNCSRSGNDLTGDESELESEMEAATVDDAIRDKGPSSPLTSDTDRKRSYPLNSPETAKMGYQNTGMSTDVDAMESNVVCENSGSGVEQVQQAKRARMESIVTSMKRSSSPQGTEKQLEQSIDDVNQSESRHDSHEELSIHNKSVSAEKSLSTAAAAVVGQEIKMARSKRKQYIPKQHDSSSMLSVSCDHFDDDEALPSSITSRLGASELRTKPDAVLRQKLASERDALMVELNRMHEQLAEIKRKYSQLCDDNGDEKQLQSRLAADKRFGGMFGQCFGDSIAEHWLRAQVINNAGFYGFGRSDASAKHNNNNEVNDGMEDGNGKFNEFGGGGAATEQQSSPLGGDTPHSFDVGRIAALLKAELACGVGSLVDEIVRNFVTKYRLNGSAVMTSASSREGGNYSEAAKIDDRKMMAWNGDESADENSRSQPRDSSTANNSENKSSSRSFSNRRLEDDSELSAGVAGFSASNPSKNGAPHGMQFEAAAAAAAAASSMGLPFMPLPSLLMPTPPSLPRYPNMSGSPPQSVDSVGQTGGTFSSPSPSVAGGDSRVRPSSSFIDRLHSQQQHLGFDGSAQDLVQRHHHAGSTPFDLHAQPSGAALAAAVARQAGLYHQAASLFGSPASGHNGGPNSGITPALPGSLQASHAAYFPSRMMPSAAAAAAAAVAAAANFQNSAAAVAAATLQHAAAASAAAGLLSASTPSSLSNNWPPSSALTTSTSTVAGVQREPEQTEALPLVVNSGNANNNGSNTSGSSMQSSAGGTQQALSESSMNGGASSASIGLAAALQLTKKKRTKVTDTRLSPRAARTLLQQHHNRFGSDSGSSHRFMPSHHHSRHYHHHHHHHSSSATGSGGYADRSRRDDDRGHRRSVGSNLASANASSSRDIVRPFSPTRASSPSAASVSRQFPVGSGNGGQDSPSVSPPTSLLPVSLPTSVAVPNPSLHHSDIMNAFFHHFGQQRMQQQQQQQQQQTGSYAVPSAAVNDESMSPHRQHSVRHHHMSTSGSSSRYPSGPIDFKSRSLVGDDDSLVAGVPSVDAGYNVHQSATGTSGRPASLPLRSKALHMDAGYDHMPYNEEGLTSTLTPMHLRKAKLMFFYVRYPSSAILKVYFPDVRFNKNNTAQLIKWFSNFREFYYIQMEKYARQALAEGVKNPNDLIVTTDSDLYRVLVLHYNRNNQLEVPDSFRTTVQATLREFFKSIQADKDQEPSWKKAIYKIIARLDDTVPEYFKTSKWMEQLAESTAGVGSSSSSSSAATASSTLAAANVCMIGGSDVKPYGLPVHHL